MSQHRKHLRVRGIVQGVGFRPFVYRLAHELDLRGFVGNDSSGVFIEIEGTPDALTAFESRLASEPPPLAHIDSVESNDIPPRGDNTFTIVHSETVPAANTLISPDLNLCDDCLRELFDPTDRRYRYPFINCTNCGPRFTIIQDVPYDRPFTTMADFPMCPHCQSEYDDPLNRRFHAQPNACPVCGPHVEFICDDERTTHDDAITRAKQALNAGQIVAVKGIGGFHLACDATNTAAVETLRQRKGRPGKPFALMVRDVDIANQIIAHTTPNDITLLTSRERPIVLLRERTNSPLSPLVAPGNPFVGVMLPYTPLHYLLLDDIPLVMTSANYSGEPIIKDNAAALDKLAPIADAFLLHNRDIHVPCDDSVVRVFQGAELPVRRSRGYAPFPVRLPLDAPPLLAVGGELKSTFCLTKDNHAFMSQHIGDMENLETLQAFTRSVEHFTTLFRVQPQAIACDYHPNYLSSYWARKYATAQNLPLIPVQHHHAHIAAVMAEHNLKPDDTVLGFSFDGTGYGTDGAVWGGEALMTSYATFGRRFHLEYMPLPGGDAAVKNPYRLALAYLWACSMEWDDTLPPVAHSTDVERRILHQQLTRNINTLQTSSMGRLFDVVAALIGVRQQVTYEAQAAIELEAYVDDTITNQYEIVIEGEQIKLADLLRQITHDVVTNVPASIIATRFHNTIAELVLMCSQQAGADRVALSGGVFQNTALLQRTVTRLQAHHITALAHHQVPPNDGGLALGQAVIAAYASSGA